MIGIISDYFGAIVTLISGSITGLVDAIASSLTGGAGDGDAAAAVAGSGE